MSSDSLDPAATCKRCNAPLSPGAVECHQCHALVHADELQQIAAEAKLLEAQKKFRAARERWLAALPLLPADAQQATWIHHHAIDLYAQALETETAQQQQKPGDHAWAKKFGPLAPLLILLSKAKTLLVLFKFKFLFSLLAFVSFYWAIYGKWFGIGFAALILCHELGHFVEVRRRHLPADLPVFLPGFGAYVKWQGMGVPLDVRAVISLAGPFAGLLSSAACIVIFRQTHSTLWLALARAGAWLNLLNLIPVWALDGGHAIHAVSKYGRILLLTGALLFYSLFSDMLFLLLAGGAAWQSFFTRAPQEGSTKITIYFALLLCGLAAVLWLAPGQGFELR